jgi:methylmalonyl-CoA mutase cobalamin-binding subunit
VELEKMGVARIFTPGAPTDEAIRFLRDAVAQRKSDEKMM